jgi:lactoylglutathione lyase
MKSVNYVIVYVGDMARSVAFYRDVFGLPLKAESPGWSEFATEGTTFALHPASAAASSEASTQSRPGQCQPGFMVPDIAEFHRKMQSHGVRCVMEPTVQDFGGTLAAYADPDGLVITLMEEPRDKKW